MFKKGDCVIHLAPTGRKRIRNCQGTILAKDDVMCLIEFDVYVGGHDGDSGGDGNCWWCFPENLELSVITLENE